MGFDSNKDLCNVANVIRIPELIYVLIISVSMLAIDGKLFWVMNLICAFIKMFLGCSYMIAAGKDIPVSMLVAMDVAISFIFFFETLLQGFDTFYVPSGAGKIIANIFGITFLAAYAYLLSEAVKLSLDKQDDNQQRVAR